MERRQAPDGELYTKSQFEEWFGGLEEWAAAAPQREQQPQQQQQRRSRQQQREQQRPPQPEEKPAEPGVRPRRVLAAGSPLFQQVVAIQRDRQSFAAVDRDDKKHIKRWQSTSRWEQGQGPDANREGGAPAAAPD